jgi:hypothetical protein
VQCKNAVGGNACIAPALIEADLDLARPLGVFPETIDIAGSRQQCGQQGGKGQNDFYGYPCPCVCYAFSSRAVSLPSWDM